MKSNTKKNCIIIVCLVVIVLSMFHFLIYGPENHYYDIPECNMTIQLHRESSNYFICVNNDNKCGYIYYKEVDHSPQCYLYISENKNIIYVYSPQHKIIEISSENISIVEINLHPIKKYPFFDIRSFQGEYDYLIRIEECLLGVSVFDKNGIIWWQMQYPFILSFMSGTMKKDGESVRADSVKYGKGLREQK